MAKKKKYGAHIQFYISSSRLQLVFTEDPADLPFGISEPFCQFTYIPSGVIMPDAAADVFSAVQLLRKQNLLTSEQPVNFYGSLGTDLLGNFPVDIGKICDVGHDTFPLRIPVGRLPYIPESVLP